MLTASALLHSVVVRSRLVGYATRATGGIAAVALVLGALLVPIAATTNAAAAANGIPAFDHIFVVMLENHSYNEIIGNSSAPYLNSLASRYGLATQYHALGHGSLLNYLAMTGGSTFGVTANCNTCYVSAPNLAVDRIEPSGRTWKAYMESMPTPCMLGDTSLYVQHHNPFVYYDNIRTNPSECNKVVPSSNLTTDLASAATTPNFAWITPNQCDNMHNCPISTGDAWLSTNVGAILSSPAFTTQNSLLAITFDEDDGTQANQVPTIFAGSSVTPGLRSSVAYDHYSVLKTVESAWNLAPLTTIDAAATPMSDFFAPRPSATVVDAFGRSVTNGWGSADAGGAWTLAGASTNYQVNGSTGTMNVTAPATGSSARLVTQTQGDVDVRVRISANKAATGGGQWAALVSRRSLTGSEYRTRLRFLANGTMSLSLSRYVSGVETLIGAETTIAGLVAHPNVFYDLHTVVTGTNPTTIRARAWLDGQPEPNTWKITQTDPTAALQSPGALGVWSYVSGTSTSAPVTFAFDDFAAAPLAAPIGVFSTTCVVLTCTADATSSTTAQPPITNYAWDWGDGATSVGLTATHTYATSGIRTVTLTITDSVGLQSTTTRTLATNVAPVASFTSSCVDLTCTVDASGSTDADGAIVNVSWDWGDATNDAGTTAVHSYAAPGSYTITLTVTDDSAATSSTTQTVTVASANVPPVASFNETCTNLTCSADASTSSDSDGTISNVAWDWGDGATSDGVTAAHSYVIAVSYSIALTVTDNRGATDTTNQTVTVSIDTPGTPIPAFTSSCTDLACSVDASSSTDATATIVTYAWDWGDGATSTGLTSTHAYSLGGTFTITLTVTDDTAAIATATADVAPAVPVNQPPIAAFTPSCTNLSCSTDASAAHDPDGIITNYAWDWGDGTTSVGLTSSHTYPAAGVYTVALTVTDDSAAVGSITYGITATLPPPPSPFATDVFARNATNGWGSATTGGAWSLAGAASLYNVSSGIATMQVTTAGGQTAAWLANTATTDSDVRVRFSANKAATGSGEWIAIVGRRVGSGIEYRGRVRIGSNKAVYAVVTDKTTGSSGEQLLGTETLVSGLTFTPGMILDARFQAFGTNPTTLRIKVWADTASEPAVWTVVKTDSQAQLQAPGAVGISSFLGATVTNAPVVFSLLAFTATSANTAPTANFSVTCATLSCSVDATSSTDPDGPIAGYTWSWGDGNTTTGATSTHLYAAPGTFTITLTVIDGGGLATATTKFAVAGP